MGRGGRQLDSRRAYATSTGFASFCVFTSDIEELDTSMRAKDSCSRITELLNKMQFNIEGIYLTLLYAADPLIGLF